ncbi:MAG: DUF2470 domain-containing protein [Chloroflexota bacterium]
MSSEAILSAQMVEYAIQHMNEDHRDNLVDYARNLAGLSWVEEAEMLGLDVEGFDLKVVGGGQADQVRITFDAPLTHANQLRPALVDLAKRAK